MYGICMLVSGSIIFVVIFLITHILLQHTQKKKKRGDFVPFVFKYKRIHTYA